MEVIIMYYVILIHVMLGYEDSKFERSYYFKAFLAAGITLFFFILAITAVQVLFGGILEPVFMGKSFSINVITILVMLMLWGYIWGVPGLIMAIPLTVFIKIILEQFPNTKIIANIITGSNNHKRPWQIVVEADENQC